MNHLYNPNRRRFTILIPLAIILASAVTLYSVPKILQAERFEDEQMRENRQKIEGMTKPERDSLKRKFKEFQGLKNEEMLEDEKKKKALRKLHKTLVADKKEGGNLTEVMQNYYKWLLTLNPRQQEEIESTSSFKERKELVDEFLADQAERRVREELRNSRSSGYWGYSFFTRRNTGSFPSLNSVSKMNLTMVDVKDIAKHLKKEFKITVDSSSDCPHLVVISDVLELHTKQELQKKSGYFDDRTLIALMEKSNANPDMIARMKHSAEKTKGDYDVLVDVVRKIREDWNREYRERKDDFLASLSKDILVRIRTRKLRNQDGRLEWEFIKDRTPEYAKLIRTYLTYLRSKSEQSRSQRGSRSRSGKQTKRKLFE